jgi:RNA polymerase sigma factor (sigma-70 family)
MEDIVQTIFLRIFRREFPEALQKNPRGYLYRAAVNGSLTTIRARRQTVDLPLERSELPPALRESSLAEERRKRLVDAIGKLSPRAVEILILRYEHGCSDAQIAALLGTSRGAIAISLFRSRSRLKKLIRTALGDMQ